MKAAARAPTPRFVTTPEAASELVSRACSHGRVALDLESNGLFAYRARICVVQLAWQGEIAIVDTLLVAPLELRTLLSSRSTTKIIHDVAFDARMLAEEGVVLENVLDTAVAARMLGRAATGLGSLLSSELGLSVDKTMQQHDWTVRPLGNAAVRYLAGDVEHLEELADRLFAEVASRGIFAEVEEETRYRLAQAIGSAGEADPRPPYARLKGIDRVAAEDLPILRRLAELREERARSLGVPAYKVLSPEILLQIARAKPKTREELAKIKGANAGRARFLADEVLREVERGGSDGAVPESELAMITKPRPPPGVLRTRRAREKALTRWRREEAKKRGVDEQVVLPGHCLQDLAALPDLCQDALTRVPGIGAFRVARDGAAILAAMSRSEGAR